MAERSLKNTMDKMLSECLMSARFWRIFLVVGVLGGWPTMSASGQSAKAVPEAPATGAASKPYVVPRTPWGDPDLQGLWPRTTCREPHMSGHPSLPEGRS